MCSTSAQPVTWQSAVLAGAVGAGLLGYYNYKKDELQTQGAVGAMLLLLLPHRRRALAMPPPLRDGVVFFVNSGSEANDLAIRLARAANKKGSQRTLVVDHAYMGTRSP